VCPPEDLRTELQQAKDQYLRTLADTDNLRKRLEREKEQAVKYSAERIIRELLPIVDSLDQALVAVDRQQGLDAIVKGVHLIYRQLLGLLEKEGVRRIPTVGEQFDPHLHEATGFVRAQDGQPDGTIVEEIHAGYTMHGHALRPALVKVANARVNVDPVAPEHTEHPSEGGSHGEDCRH
jgi:molecular chaperone GrpE